MNGIERVEFIFEDMQSKFDFLVEAISIMQTDIAEMKPLVAMIPSMLLTQNDMKKIFGVHSSELDNHRSRILNLEQWHRPPNHYS